MALFDMLKVGGVPLLAVLGFLYWNGQQGGRLKLDFVNCDVMESPRIGSPCPTHPLMPRLWTSYFYSSIAARAEEIRRSGSTPVVLHIGANTFWEDKRMYTPLMQLLKPHSPRLVLVEPQTNILNVTRQNAEELKLPEGKLDIVNKAVAPDCSGGDLTMYGWSNRLQELFTRPVPMEGYVSQKRENVLAAIKGAVIDPLNYWASELARVAHLPNLTEYVEELVFVCITPTDFLAEMGIAAKDIAAMVIDAEGLDDSILEGFLPLTGFRPAFMMHETMVRAPTFHQQLWQSLRARGYLVGITVNDMNIISVDERLFKWPLGPGLLRWLLPFVPCDDQRCGPPGGAR
mmetsp:Transcript_93276/g.273045  ORF Transcript_93276/g.273045 Transcript_93276/m.273045 type:complete len:345 (-) Transcript_93276:102-1136(-)